jgi:hypothetical protein
VRLTKGISDTVKQDRRFLKGIATLLAEIGDLEIQLYLQLVQEQIEFLTLGSLAGRAWVLWTGFSPLVGVVVMSGSLFGGFDRARFTDDRRRRFFGIGSPDVPVFGKPGRTLPFLLF